MQLYASHQGGLRVAVPASLGDLDLVATVGDGGGARGTRGASTLTVTIAHLSAVGWQPEPLRVLLSGGGCSAANAEVVELRANGWNETSSFTTVHSVVPISEGGLNITIPPFSLVQLQIDDVLPW